MNPFQDPAIRHPSQHNSVSKIVGNQYLYNFVMKIKGNLQQGNIRNSVYHTATGGLDRIICS